MTEIEPITYPVPPISDERLDDFAVSAAVHGCVTISLKGETAIRARILHLEAQIAALQAERARVMPEARRYATVEEIEALPDGAYWVALDRMRDTILPWNLFLRIGGDWVWHGDEVIEADADMIGAWIVGPLPLPTLPTEETDPNG